jgi:hypothetical protein
MHCYASKRQWALIVLVRVEVLEANERQPPRAVDLDVKRAEPDAQGIPVLVGLRRPSSFIVGCVTAIEFVRRPRNGIQPTA